MYNMFLNFSNTFLAGFLVRQVIVILALYLLGLMLQLALSSNPDKNSLVPCLLLAYPLGLAQFSITAYLIIALGIPYNNKTITIVMIALMGLYVYFASRGRKCNQAIKENKGLLILAGILVILIALISVSGLAPISISNDSMYFFHEYPRYIVHFGGLRDQFDTFLTDTGLGVISIETLPFLYGFNESFGIREFMHISFIAYMSYLVYKKSHKMLAAIVVALLTIASSPVYVLGHWAMANMYFMELFFMAAAFMSDFFINREDDKPYSVKELLPCILITIACAFTRMEGGIFILLLLVCYSLLNIKGRDLIIYLALPILIMLAIYEIRLFIFYKIDNPYTFLTPGKALIQGAAFVCIIVYLAFIRDRLGAAIKNRLPLLFIGGLVGVNGLLFLYKKELYIGNLKAFYGNFCGQSGWGMLPHLAIASIVIIIVANLIINKESGKSKRDPNAFERHFFLLLTIGFMLVTLAVSFMRGDVLLVAVGDSGNRVMLQAAPLIIYTITLYFIRLNERFKENDNTSK